MSILGTLPVLASAAGCGSDEPLALDTGPDPWPGLDVTASRFGGWRLEDGLPVFVYDADHEALPAWERFILPPTKRHWILLGNRAISLEAGNDGTVALFDESDGLRWLVAADDTGGTGVSLIRDGGVDWGSAFASRPPGSMPDRVFAPTWFSVRAAHAGLNLVRTVLCPEGEVPWVLVRVELSLAIGTAARAIVHEERWQLRRGS